MCGSFGVHPPDLSITAPLWVQAHHTSHDNIDHADALMDQFTRSPSSMTQRDEDMFIASIAAPLDQCDHAPCANVDAVARPYAPAPLGNPTEHVDHTPPPLIAPQVDAYPQVTNLGTLIDLLV